MLDTDTSYDSFLAGAFGPTLLIDLGQDLILATTAEAQSLLAHDLTGTNFAPFIADGLDMFVVFLTEVEHRGMAWTRQVTLQSANQTVCTPRGSHPATASHARP